MLRRGCGAVASVRGTAAGSLGPTKFDTLQTAQMKISDYELRCTLSNFLALSWRCVNAKCVCGAERTGSKCLVNFARWRRCAARNGSGTHARRPTAGAHPIERDERCVSTNALQRQRLSLGAKCREHAVIEPNSPCLLAHRTNTFPIQRNARRNRLQDPHGTFATSRDWR